MKRVFIILWTLITLLGMTLPALAAWEPKGPIKLIVAFRAGGGADTQARLIIKGLEANKGWQVIPTHITGKGGTNAARALVKAPADGQTLSMIVLTPLTYNPLISKKLGYTSDDFTYITTTAGSQMGLVAKVEKGWKTIEDLVAYAKGGKALAVASMSPRLDDGLYVLAKQYGITINSVSVKGGKGSMNAILAGDVDAGWGAGIQTKGVLAGNLVNLMSAEDKRLNVSPDAPTMRELGMPFSFGAKFLIAGPKGMPQEATETIAAAVQEVIADKNSEAHKFITKAFGGPLLISGVALQTLVKKDIVEHKDLLSRLN